MYDVVVIGGGIIGLATANRVLEERPGAKVLVLEKEAAVAQHQSGHNSGVIHAGVYYAPGSLKARLCKAGVEATLAFARANDVPFEQCGKLIVATDALEVERLGALEQRVKANGLEYRYIEAAELKELEPNIAGEAAILVPSTGIVDYPLICRKLAERISDAGGEVKLRTRVVGLDERDAEIVVETNKGSFETRLLVGCAGLQSDRLARMAGLENDFRIVPFRGEYYRVSQSRGNLVDHLIYPVPDPKLPFLGVHLTRMIGGYLTVGPNAILSLGRESYDANLPQARDLWDMGRFPGLWKLFARQAGAGLYELGGSLSKRVYLKRCQKYCPSLELKDLEPYRPGVRAQNVSNDGQLVDDFRFEETRRTLHVCNAPSPAATSAFPIAADIVSRALRKLN